MTMTVGSAEYAPGLAVILAAAHVTEVDEGHGFCASVYRGAHGGHTVLRLDRSIRGAPHEGRVLRWAMEHCMRGTPVGYFVYALAPSEAPGR